MYCRWTRERGIELMCVRGEAESVIGIASIVKRYYQGHIDSKEKRARNLVPIKILTDAKNSNKLCIICH